MTAPVCIEFRVPEEHQITPVSGSHLRGLVLITAATLILVFGNLRARGQGASVIPSTKIATDSVPTLKAKVQEVPLVLSVTDRDRAVPLHKAVDPIRARARPHKEAAPRRLRTRRRRRPESTRKNITRATTRVPIQT